MVFSVKLDGEVGEVGFWFLFCFGLLVFWSFFFFSVNVCFLSRFLLVGFGLFVWVGWFWVVCLVGSVSEPSRLVGGFLLLGWFWCLVFERKKGKMKSKEPAPPKGCFLSI